MKKNIQLFLASLPLLLISAAAAQDNQGVMLRPVVDTPAPPPLAAAVSPPIDMADASLVAAEKKKLADERIEEMRKKIVASVEDILQLYGNPAFAEVITNDAAKADELRKRIGSASEAEQARKEVEELKAKKTELLKEIALQEIEVERLRARAAQLRAVLDQSANAIDQLQRAMEDNATPIPPESKTKSSPPENSNAPEN